MHEIVMIISIATGVVLITFITQWYRIRQREYVNKERMALIEKGVYEFPGDVRKVDYAKYLLVSFLAIGFGLALIIGAFIGHDDDMIMPGAIFILPGLGMLLFYYIQWQKEVEQRKEKGTGQ